MIEGYLEFSKAKKYTLEKWTDILQKTSILIGAIKNSCGFCEEYRFHDEDGKYVNQQRCPAFDLCTACLDIIRDSEYWLITKNALQLRNQVRDIIQKIHELELEE